MEIIIEGGLIAKINQKDNTASIIKSPKATGTVFVPRFAEYEGSKYKIISLSEDSFQGNFIELLTFPEDSELESIETHAFRSAHIKKLKIPNSLKFLKYDWCYFLYDLTEIEISPKNHHFMYFDKKYLLGKSQENSDEFDILYYARFDIEEALIPPQVKILKQRSFGHHKKLKTVEFTENSQLKSIENNTFELSSIQKVVLPASFEEIDGYSFSDSDNLVDIEISPKNKNFQLFENKYLLKKSDPKNTTFDILICARRDIENAIIPSQIKVISNCSFQNCQKLESLSFEPNSSLEIIESYAFSGFLGQEKITLPTSVKQLKYSAFDSVKKLKYFEFLGKTVHIMGGIFHSNKNLKTIIFPNAETIRLDKYSLSGLSKDTKILIPRSTKLEGSGVEQYTNLISYIDDSKSTNPKVKDDETKANELMNKITNLKNENDDLKSYIFYLKNHLDKYEDVISYEDFINPKDHPDIEIEGEKEMKSDQDDPQRQVFIGADDEEFHNVVSKIGEGSTCDVYKVVDQRTNKAMCKKVIKSNNEETDFQLLRNSIKEIEILLEVKHPCICEAIGYNMQEELPRNEEEEQEEVKTTVALFFELLPYSIKSIIDKGMMNNTLKVRVAIEVAFGMSHIHSLGMMHRDLKLENIMMNNAFESKIIDFGLVHVPELSGTGCSLTKGVGTLAFMSPEMTNEEEYDNKTDVYSYGIVLFALFTGKLPAQTMREKMNNVPMKYPSPSSKISEFCIDLIKRCTSFEPSKRPTFDEIIDDMARHKFELASDVDTRLIKRRYQSLNIIKAKNQRKRKKID